MDITIRPLERGDLDEADRIMRLAFGTFVGLPDPATFMGDAGYVRTRWLADPAAAFASDVDGELAGSNFVATWGSVGFFGPLTVRPDLWDRGVGKRLLEPALDLLETRRTRHTGLFTFAHSPKHLGLYHRFGFAPRFLTAIMSKPVAPGPRAIRWSKYSDVPEPERANCLDACRELTDRIYPGLDLRQEIGAVDALRLGDTVLLWDGSTVARLAICHHGAGTEAGSGVCYVKFAAVRPGAGAAESFDGLIDASESFAAARELAQLVAGVNTGCHEAYGRMLARGFRTDLVGVAMQRHNDPGYHRPGIFILDDWR
ncbi:MAG: GNAT family N-acetyltransferase [Chloroflexota bacterium]|nr:GNAT family N-acetyltransferase [Chloroflexota bacterium]